MVKYHTSKESVHAAINAAIGKCEILMIPNIDSKELQNSAREKAKSLGLLSGWQHVPAKLPDTPALIKYFFYE